MALVLSRRLGESVRIRVSEVEAVGGVIDVEILEVGERRVKLGISAPEPVHIVRGELADDGS